MKKYISLFLKYYCFITTATLLVVACAVGLIYNAQADTSTLWQILVTSIPAALYTVIVFNVNAENMNYLFRMLIHYICLCVTMGFFGYKFHWIDFSLFGIVFMCICVAVVYAFTFLISWLSDRENAKNINKALEEKYKE